jgi:hypothetical protein
MTTYDGTKKFANEGILVDAIMDDPGVLPLIERSQV